MRPVSAFLALLFLALPFPAAADQTRTISGVLVTSNDAVIPGLDIVARYSSGEQQTTTASDGTFRFEVADEAVTLHVGGKHIRPVQLEIPAGQPAENLELRIEYVIAPVHQSIVITASALDPGIDRRNGAVYRNSLFSRDDQIFHTLDAGINAGQHEGGGKSVEIRRFGFNLDHGGVGGGLKVLVDNVQQNQGTQGHGQGYLGQLKSLTPELVAEVDILNGPFSAEYGDFSGLGVVHIRQRESLPDQFTGRLQGGAFNTRRSFLAYSPALASGDALLAYELASTDGPFRSPLRYRRHNLTGSYTWRAREGKTVGLKLNAGTNRFTSSGQIPLDEVATGRLDRFGFLDPDNGGRARSATLAAYFRKDGKSGDVLKLDGFLSRSLFDLFSNFTFFLNDPVNGDEVQQHDSRLVEGANAQYLRPYKLFGLPVLLIAGGNLHATQVSVSLLPSVGRQPLDITTSAHATIINNAGYVQQGLDLIGGRLHLEGGLRYDAFRFHVEAGDSPALSRVARPSSAAASRVEAGDSPAPSGTETAGRLQPKASFAFTPSRRLPLTLHGNYGRGIASQDARGVVQQPGGPKISTTDFYQVGVSSRLRRLSLSAGWFLIDRSNEQVYIPDDGSIEFRGPSRSYGFEMKSSVHITRHLAWNSGWTQVSNAFYRGTSPREYVAAAPHTVANSGLTLSHWRGFSGSLRYRYAGGYRLDELNPAIRASGLSVFDFSLSRRLSHNADLNLAVDNLTNKRYFETQNYFESRLRPGDPVVARIHGTPGYPIGVTVGLTFHLGGK